MPLTPIEPEETTVVPFQEPTHEPQKDLEVTDAVVLEIEPEVELSPSPTTAPQIIIEREKSLAYYVGFAFLTLLAITFFFMPGISLVYLVHKINPLNAPTAWIFAAVLSVIVWGLFKVKIAGIKRASYFYLCFCLSIFTILLIVYFTSDSGNIFRNILAMLTGTTL